jgi:hypothetical protein
MVRHRGCDPRRRNVVNSIKKHPSSTGPEKSRVNLAGPPAKPKYSLVTDSGQVP